MGRMRLILLLGSKSFERWWEIGGGMHAFVRRIKTEFGNGRLEGFLHDSHGFMRESGAERIGWERGY